MRCLKAFSFFGETLIVTRLPTNVNPRYSQPEANRTLLVDHKLQSLREKTLDRREHSLGTALATHEDHKIIAVAHEAQAAAFQFLVQVVQQYVRQQGGKADHPEASLPWSVATRLRPSHPLASSVLT